MMNKETNHLRLGVGEELSSMEGSQQINYSSICLTKLQCEQGTDPANYLNKAAILLKDQNTQPGGGGTHL